MASEDSRWRTQKVRKLVIGLTVACGYLGATTAFFTPPGSTGADGPVSAEVDFTINTCVTVPSVQCTLLIAFTNNQANPTGAGQLLSDLTFVLMNGATELTSPGTLNGSISNGSGGAVKVFD